MKKSVVKDFENKKKTHKKNKFNDVPNPELFTDLDFVRLLLYLCLPEVRASQPPSRRLRAPRLLPRTTNYHYRISDSLLLPLLPPLSATAIDYRYYRLLLPILPNVTSSCEY